MRITLMTLPLSACALGEKIDDTATTTLTPTPITACVVAQDANPDATLTDALSLTLHGQVTEIGTGAPPEGCVDPDPWFAHAVDDGADVWWFRVADPDLGTYTVAARAGGGVAPVDVDEMVSVQWRWDEAVPYNGEAGDNELLVADFEDVAEAWVAGAASLSELDPPSQVSLTRGDEINRVPLVDDCFTEVDYALDATVDGVTANLDFGEAASLGMWTVLHGGTTDRTDLTCSEMEGSWTAIAVTR